MADGKLEKCFMVAHVHMRAIYSECSNNNIMSLEKSKKESSDKLSATVGFLSSDDYKDVPHKYNCAMCLEYGSFNLLEDIRTSLIETVTTNQMILIRRMLTDKLYPYDASIFLSWWNMSHTDPVTREDLSYITAHVNLQCEMMMLPKTSNIPNLMKDVTSTMTVKLLEKYVMEVKKGSRNISDDEWVMCRFFLEPSVWKKANYLFNVTPEQSETIMSERKEGEWMMRRSSKHKSECVMPNSECVTFTLKKVASVFHTRVINVLGVGWFWANCTDHLSTFFNLGSHRRNFAPICASFVEMIEYVVIHCGLDWNKIIKDAAAA